MLPRWNEFAELCLTSMLFVDTLRNSRNLHRAMYANPFARQQTPFQNQTLFGEAVSFVVGFTVEEFDEIQFAGMPYCLHPYVPWD